MQRAESPPDDSPGPRPGFIVKTIPSPVKATPVPTTANKFTRRCEFGNPFDVAINEQSDSLPLADVLRGANDLVTAGLIEDWALGGALAAIYYVEPFTTYDADIFFIPKDKGLTAGIPAIYAHLQAHSWQVEREHLLVRGFPVQFLAASGLTEEAVREAERIDYEGVPAKVFRAEHIMAIAASVGRAKDKARIEQLLQQADLDQSRLENILQRHKLKLPNP